MNRTLFVQVPVSTVWTSPDRIREIDYMALTKEADMQQWLGLLTEAQRLDLYEGKRVQTQLLFGEKVEVISEEGEWMQIMVPSQPSEKRAGGYPGWVPSCQLTHGLPQTDGKKEIIKKHKALLLLEEGRRQLMLSFGTEMTVLERTEEETVVETPLGKGIVGTDEIGAVNERDGSGIDFIRTGTAFLGLPYLWGGTSSFGYDCSGFTYSICRANGVLIPRDAHEQAAHGDYVPFSAVMPGDLLFFASEGGKGAVRHVGFYEGNGKMLHSPKTGKNIEIIGLTGSEYEKELCCIRRYRREGSSWKKYSSR